MNKQIHRFAALLPVLALGASTMIYFFFGIAQFQYKEAAHENIAQLKGLSVIKMSLKDFKKLTSSTEIWYSGELYDISSFSITNDSAYVTVFHDEQEESLIKDIADDFVPYDNYISDNVIHIIKHRIHIPDDNKIQTSITPLSLNCLITASRDGTLPYFTKYSARVYTNILKPPPNPS